MSVRVFLNYSIAHMYSCPKSNLSDLVPFLPRSYFVDWLPNSVFCPDPMDKSAAVWFLIRAGAIVNNDNGDRMVSSNL